VVAASQQDPDRPGPAFATEPEPLRTLPTVHEVLQFESLRRGRVDVIAGASGLDRPVRWLHVSELVTIAKLLRGGELILTTGIALPDDRRSLLAYVTQLNAVGASGLVFGLGPRYLDSPPPELLAAANRLDFPVMVLRRTMPFVEITEDVHSRIVDAQIDELRAADRIHSTFTEMALEGAGPNDIVAQLARMSGRPVLLENLSRQVLAHDPAAESAAEVLDDWEGRSRRVRATPGTVYDPDAGLLVTPVGARGEHWGRLAMACAEEPPPRFSVMLERGAQALALSRLVTRDQDTLERQAHRTLLTSLLSPTKPVSELVLEAQAVGVTLTRRTLTGIVLRARSIEDLTLLERQAWLRMLNLHAAEFVRAAAEAALVGSIEDSMVGMLLATSPHRDVAALVDGLAASLRGAVGGDAVVVAVGGSVGAPADARHSLVEAMQVAQAALFMPDDKIVYRMPELRLRGLLYWLREDVRLQAFVERELGPLMDYDQRHSTNLVDMLEIYLRCSRNKSAAAARAQVSRPWMYECLAKIGRILAVDLDSEETCVSLQVALMALQAVRRA
jgi:purine catabolism regulator